MTRRARAPLAALVAASALAVTLTLAAHGVPRLAAATATAPLTRPPPAPAARVHAVGAVGITVSDLDRAVAFYRDVLSFRVAAQDEAVGETVEQLEGVFGAHTRRARMTLGAEAIVLTQYLAPRGRPAPADLRGNDRLFQHIAIVVSDMERAYQRLRQHQARHISNQPQTLPAWNRAAAGIRAFYFADPDDHPLELIWFPPGKGDPRWQRAGARDVFVGIDHTAIAAGDTERSLRFYRDALGLRVAGESENYGPEQEHLNAVFGAHLRITGLRADAGPGIELLEYLSPRDGRAAPGDLRANDVAHWQTALEVGDVAASAGLALGAGGTAVSARPVDGADALLHSDRATLVRDPDGHAMLLLAGATAGAKP